MRIRALLVAIALGLSLALAPGPAARNTSVSVTQTKADLSQALTALRRLHFRPGSPSRRLRVITIDDTRRFQTMQGFGAAMTDTSAWLIWDKLTPRRRGTLMRELFAPAPGGIGISYVRVPIAASDFTGGGRRTPMTTFREANPTRRSPTSRSLTTRPMSCRCCARCAGQPLRSSRRRADRVEHLRHRPEHKCGHPGRLHDSRA
jgi:glucosylceramidase